MSKPSIASIGLGANLGEPLTTLRQAVPSLAELPHTEVLAVSRFYRTPAWGQLQQPDFVNAAALLKTALSPQSLLRHLLDIERLAGRDRDRETAAMRWGPRVLDLDLLLYGDRVINEPGLRVPHPYLHERAFALVPLAEIAADQPFPGVGTVADALRGVDVRGVEAIAAS